MATVHNSESQGGVTSFIGKCTKNAVVWTAKGIGTYIGQAAGRGYVVLNGSKWIYNMAYAKAFELTPWYLGGNSSATMAAYTAVGAAEPYLASAGAIAGGVLGYALTSIAIHTIFKVGSFVANAFSSDETEIPADTHYKSVKVKYAKDEMDLPYKKFSDEIEALRKKLLEQRIVVNNNSPYKPIVLPSLRDPTKVTYEI